jgi:hypothetical protein
VVHFKPRSAAEVDALGWRPRGLTGPHARSSYQTAFALETFALYVRSFGSLLNTSLFFLVAALIVSALAWLAYPLHRSKTVTDAAT